MHPSIIHLLENAADWKSLDEAVKNGDSITAALPEGAVAFLTARAAAQRSVICIAWDELEAESIYESLKTLYPGALFFPDVDVVPYSHVLPSPDKMADRIRTLYALSANRPESRAVVTTLESFLRLLPPVSALAVSALEFTAGGAVDREELSARLTALGYVRGHKAVEPGSYSIRGDIIDIYPPDMGEAVRLSLFGDTVDSIRHYNPITQVSTRVVTKARVIPASEFSLVREMNEGYPPEYTHESESHSRLPSFYRRLSVLAEYCPEPPLIISRYGVEEGTGRLLERYNQGEDHGTGKSRLLADFEKASLAGRGSCVIRTRTYPEDGVIDTRLRPPPEFGEGFTRFLADLETSYLSEGYRVLILVEYPDLARRLMSVLARFNPVLVPDSGDFTPQPLMVAVSPFEHGFVSVGDNPLLALSESDLSGKKRLFRKRIRQIDTMIEDALDIQEGEHVVHLNYGIGVFKNIQRLNVLGKEKDYILLEYAHGEKLFVPLEQSGLIGKYIGGVTKKPILDSLGGKSWAKKKDRIQKSIEEYAQKLVAIYARRSLVQGHAFASDTEYQREFEDKFEFIETPDQVRVMEEIKRDMENPRPMDRLLCGDVGFGKTEVAMRAAFKAVMDGRQVALIAPTTVLAEQHYYTLQKRFLGFPVRIEHVSRFTDPRKLRAIEKELLLHRVDILIGTHKLFSDRLQFRALGLVIIDEEHKFGVSHKEILKERHPLVDFLSLSATPIPRTLNMAMATIRDISLLQTPPDMRIPVQTFVSEFNFDTVEYAIRRELERGGQVFFVHNTIKRLPEYAYQIERMVPGARVTTGHGQMEEEELDRAFLGFVKGEFNVFVCTTIIDSGLDIPNANTIIVSDANRFGLSQLYQLKGRVGRGKREGYAYFLYPAERVITETAQKRLFVLSEYTDLGAGFNIALKDLEIRGAGNILGREQHGNIIAVGYDVYMRLLREEIERLRGTLVETIDTQIDLQYDAYIPADYIPDNSTKMEIYKKILSVRNEDEVRALSDELMDRFGRIPAEVSTLFEISRLKIKAGELGIESIMEKGGKIEMRFSRYSKADPHKVMQAVANGRHEISFSPQDKDKLIYKGFESGVTIKVRRLMAFLTEIAE